MAIISRLRDNHFQRLIILVLLRRILRRRSEKYMKRFWVRKIYEERNLKGEFHHLMQEMMLFDHDYFFRCFRMLLATLEKLLSWIAPFIRKQSASMREPIEPSERLSVTLRYLVAGDALVSIAGSYRTSSSVVGRIIGKTCKVLLDVFIEKGYLTALTRSAQWKKIARRFEEKWTFHMHLVQSIRNT